MTTIVCRPTVQAFLDEKAEIGAGLSVPGATFTYEYNNWCKENNLLPLGGKRLSKSLRLKGFEYKNVRDETGKQAKSWSGFKTI